jgi:hypothetical protein
MFPDIVCPDRDLELVYLGVPKPLSDPHWTCWERNDTNLTRCESLKLKFLFSFLRYNISLLQSSNTSSIPSSLTTPLQAG